MKRVGTLLLALIMAFSLAMPAAAAEKATATTMRLMETEGTVSVKNAAGKTLSVKDNMRLYNGYEVATKAKSYAYISLDSSKAVKLDASSAGEIAKSGRQLELKLTAGKMFFNVPVALESDESMEIRTSTMMMGIRGTAGWVEVLDRYTTRVGVLEGMVTIHSQHPLTGADRSVTITGGQTATIIRHERAQAMMQELIRQGIIIEDNIVEELTEIGQIVEELREDGIPGFAAAEVADDTDLRQRINEESPLDADKIAQNAAAKLAADEAKAKQDAEEVQDNTTTVGMKNLFAEVRTEVVTKTNTVIEKGDDVPVPSGLNNPDAGAVNGVLAAAGIAAVTVTNAGSSFNITELDMKPSDVVYIIGGEFMVDEPWEVKGKIVLMKGASLSNTSDITVEGTLEIGHGATLENGGLIQVNSANSLIVGGALLNNGRVVVGSTTVSGKLVVEADGRLHNCSGAELVVDGPALHVEVAAEENGNSGRANVENVLMNQGYIYNYAGAEFVNAGTLENQGEFWNGGINFANGARVALRAEVYNCGEIENSGSLKNFADFYNEGIVFATEADVAAFENCSGVLYMEEGIIRAAEDAIALCYSGGSLEGVNGGEITYSGYGEGCALYINDEESPAIEFLRESTALLRATTAQNLVKVSNRSWYIEDTVANMWINGTLFEDVPVVRVVVATDEEGFAEVFGSYPYEENSEGICTVKAANIRFHAPS